MNCIASTLPVGALVPVFVPQPAGAQHRSRKTILKIIVKTVFYIQK